MMRQYFWTAQVGLLLFVVVAGILAQGCRARKEQPEPGQPESEDAEGTLDRLFRNNTHMKEGQYAVSWSGYRDGTFHNIVVREWQGTKPAKDYAAASATWRTDGLTLTLVMKDVAGTRFTDASSFRMDTHTVTIPLRHP